MHPCSTSIDTFAVLLIVAIDSNLSGCLISNNGGIGMGYDWDGHKTRKIRLARLVAAMAIGVTLPLLVSVWSAYVR